MLGPHGRHTAEEGRWVQEHRLACRHWLCFRRGARVTKVARHRRQVTRTHDERIATAARCTQGWLGGGGARSTTRIVKVGQLHERHAQLPARQRVCVQRHCHAHVDYCHAYEWQHVCRRG
jgi:hypothetical protein